MKSKNLENHINIYISIYDISEEILYIFHEVIIRFHGTFAIIIGIS
jgi:hypothetical protein